MMSQDGSPIERRPDRDPIEARRRYRAPSLVKGPMLATVTSSDGAISGGLH
jgi:hypothetical protein